MTHETHSELLEFLADVSRQVDALLNYHPEVLEDDYEDSTKAVQERLVYKLDHLYSKSQILDSIDPEPQQHVLPNLLNPSWNQIEDHHHLDDLQPPQISRVYSSTSPSLNTTRRQHIDITTQVIQRQYDQYFPPASNNFVNIMQYSAKPSQRQLTGYPSRDENPLVNFAMPKQDYQPECAYCYWLATHPSSSSIISMSPMNVATTTNDHQFDTSNYAYHNG